MIRKFLTGLSLALGVAAAVAVYVNPQFPPLERLTAWAAQASATSTSASPAPSEAPPAGPKAPSSAPEVLPAGPASHSAQTLLAQSELPAEHAERRLLEIFALVEQSRLEEALEKSTALTQDQPNFQLAQLVHGDLLNLRYQPMAAALGGVSNAQAEAAGAQLASLRAETRKRLDALQNRPPVGTLPVQFVALSSSTRHAVAIDTSRSRLYLFENQATLPDHPTGTGAPDLKLIADFFISVGKAGVGKQVEGDGRTPLGNYYITSVKDKKDLPAFYGAGALPINYPNAFDLHASRTGSGIWLHGTPPNQFVRATLASEGCVVLSNPDMDKLLVTVAPRTTPVVIAEQLQWVAPEVLATERQVLEAVITQWQAARNHLTSTELAQRFGAPVLADSGPEKGPAVSTPPQGTRKVKSAAALPNWQVPPYVRMGVTQLSLLQSRSPQPSMVATFEETINGQPSGLIRRQYWLQTTSQWQLLQDTVMAYPQQQVNAALAHARAQAQASGALPQASVDEDPPPPKAAPTTKPSSAPERTTAASNTRVNEATTPRDTRKADEQAVRQALQAWAKAWSQKNMAAYYKAYDSGFPAGQSRTAWELERRQRIVNKSNIRVGISRLVVEVQGKTATARFVQTYQADQLNVSGRKTLKFVKRGPNWLITHEDVN